MNFLVSPLSSFPYPEAFLLRDYSMLEEQGVHVLVLATAFGYAKRPLHVRVGDEVLRPNIDILDMQ
jgi:hypothetical protein